MAVAPHLEALSRTHADLDALVQAEEAHSWINRDKVLRLKQQKLHIKEEIERLRLMAEDAHQAEKATAFSRRVS